MSEMPITNENFSLGWWLASRILNYLTKIQGVMSP